MTRDDVLAMALALPETEAAPHFDRTAVKVHKGRIFATFGAAGDMNVKLTPDEQAIYVESASEAVSVIAGGWGRMGWTRVALAEADRALLLSILHAGWRNAAPKKLLAAYSTPQSG
jgi:hypothetical protein